MSVYSILQFPDPRLRTKAEPVVVFDSKLKTIVDNMFETMYQAQGIGLAATQVNIHYQIIVIDISEEQNQPLVFINPGFEVLDDEYDSYSEGCLSVPGFQEDIERPKKIRVNYKILTGEAMQLEPEGLLAVCIQHEIDHLKGKLFVDYISPLKRQRIRKQIQKQQRSA